MFCSPVARLRGDTNLYGKTFHEQALVDQWLDFSTNELEIPRALWLFPLTGVMEYNATAHKEGKNGVSKAMTILNNHLLSNTYLVGEGMTIADIAVATALVALYGKVMDEKFLKEFANVTR